MLLIIIEYVQRNLIQLNSYQIKSKLNPHDSLWYISAEKHRETTAIVYYTLQCVYLCVKKDLKDF